MSLLLDKIIIVMLCYFFLSGLIRGFLKSLLGPIACIFCSISAIIFYDVNRNILLACLIAIAGTILLTIAFNLLLAAGEATLNTESRGKVFFVSRVLGSITNLFWQGNIMFILIILMSAFPLTNERINSLISEIPKSKMMALYYDKVINRHIHLQAIASTATTLREPAQYQTILKSKQFLNFNNNDKFKKFITDPKTIEAINEKDDYKILTNPALLDLITNDQAMYTLTDLIEWLYAKNLAALQESPSLDPKP